MIASKPVVEPLHTAQVGNGELRFFKGPTSGPDFPWIVFEDLGVCLGLARSLRREFQRKLVSGPWKDDVKTIATSTGIATIAPHFCAQGLIGAAVHIGAAQAGIEMEYVRASIVAMKQITAGMSETESFHYSIAAAQRVMGTEKPTCAP